MHGQYWMPIQIPSYEVKRAQIGMTVSPYFVRADPEVCRMVYEWRV